MNQLQREITFKDLGMSMAADANYKNLQKARDVAYHLARSKEEISINDVREALPNLDFSGNWVGSIFKPKAFQFTGRYEPARHKGGHARDVKKWELKT